MFKDFFKIFLNEDKGDGSGGASDPAPKKEEAEPEQAKYTDKQLNDLLKKEKEKTLTKAESEILSLAGLKSKEELAELVKLKQAQMSESERTAARIKELEEKEKDHISRADRAEAKSEALAAGVAADKADRVVKLALSGDYEGANVSEKIKAVLAEFPEFIGKQGGGAFGGGTKNESPNTEEALIERALKQAGIKGR